MATGKRDDPVRGYNFTISLMESANALSSIALTVGIAPVGGFSECSGLDMTMQPEEYREGGRNGSVLKFPNRISHGNLRLRRGVALTNDLFDWYSTFVQGNGKRRDGTITLLNDEQQAVRVWKFTRGFPIRWVGPTLNAAQSGVAIEELEIAHEGFKMVSAGTKAVVDAVGGLLGL